jgi:putative acetyltransferase
MNDFQIEKVKPSDNSELAAMIRAVFDEHGAPHLGTVYSDPTTDTLYELFQAPNSVLWVAHHEGEIAGCCGIYPTSGLDDDCVELVKYYLSRRARSKGIGRALMQKCIDSAKAFGFKRMYLESLPEFSNAVRIYIKQGFSILDSPLGQSGHGGCSIWMVKKL